MPLVTRKMIEYMKENGLKNVEKDDNDPDILSAQSGVEVRPAKKKKIRELPSAVDPVQDTESMKKVKSKDKRKRSLDKGKSNTKPKSKRKSNNTSMTRSQSTKKSKVRLVDAAENALKPIDVDDMIDYKTITFDEKKVRFIQALLKSNVRRLDTIQAADPVKGNEDAFDAYTVDESKPVAKGTVRSAKAMYEATHRDFPKECRLVCKQYDAQSAGLDPKSSFFLKVLRHLGKKHPNVIQTWDIFSKGDVVYVFQELAPYGNLHKWLSKKGNLEEGQAQQVAKYLRCGMDFLGDMGVSHRSIRPEHVLVLHSDMRVSLTGFQCAIAYYNDKKDDLNYQKCLSTSKKKEMEFQAPEVYGNEKSEQFDPTTADVWSFGATLYFGLCQKYPYDTERNSPKIGNEIQKNILALKISKNGLSALGHMLTIESTKRISVEKLREHPWFKEE